MNDVADVDRRLAAALRCALELDRQHCAHGALLDAALLDAAVKHRVVGLLWAATERGHFVSGGQDGVREACLAAQRSVLRIEETIIVATDVLQARSIESRLLKGAAHGHLDYPSPELRTFGDADLLVRRRDLQACLAALQAAGFRRALPAVRRDWERRFAKAVQLIAPNGVELDLHLSLAGGYFGALLQAKDIWADPHSIILGGRRISTLNLNHRFIHACVHATLGAGFGLRSAADVAILVGGGELEWDEVDRLATGHGCRGVVLCGTRRAYRLLDLDPTTLPIWAIETAIGDRQQAMIDRYAQGSGPDWGPEAATTLAALGVVDRARFLLGVLAPSRASLRARGRTRRTHLRMVARRLTAQRQLRRRR